MTRGDEDHGQVKMPQEDRSVLVTIRAVIEPLVPDRMVITLTRYMINPDGETETETTSSIDTACRHMERWLTNFAESAD